MQVFAGTVAPREGEREEGHQFGQDLSKPLNNKYVLSGFALTASALTLLTSSVTSAIVLQSLS